MILNSFSSSYLSYIKEYNNIYSNCYYNYLQFIDKQDLSSVRFAL